MKVKNLNSASRKTKQKIKETFAELMNEKHELAHITVTELVKRAGITRSSFYTHYDNIYDVASDIQNETMEVLLKNTENLTTLEDFEACIDEITKYLKENGYIYSMILSSNEVLIYADRLVKLLNKKLDIALKIKSKETQLKMTFYAYGCINLIIKYFRNELEDCNLDDINKLMKQLVIDIFA
jgi:AcrR family transcriptional regulator